MFCTLSYYSEMPFYNLDQTDLMWSVDISGSVINFIYNIIKGIILEINSVCILLNTCIFLLR